MSEALDQEIRTLQSIYWSERDPDGLAFAPLADAFMRKGEMREALSLLKDGTSRHPEYSTGHAIAARLFLDNGMQAEAEIAARRVLDLDPENLVGLSVLGAVLSERGEADEAERVFETLTSVDPESEEAVSAEGRLEALDATPAPAPWFAEPVVEVMELQPPDPGPELEEVGLGTLDFGALRPDAERGLEEPALEVMDLDALAPDLEPEVMDLAALAPDPEPDVMDLAALAPDPEPEVVDIESLAPDPEPEGEVVDLTALAPDPEPAVVDIESLAPDPEPEGEVVDLAALAPDPEPAVVDIESLAPDPEPEVVDLVSLAPDSAPVEPAETDPRDPVPTRTLAELYVRQGFTEPALDVYRHLLAQEPGADDLRDRIAELERGPGIVGIPGGRTEKEEEVETLARDLAEIGDAGHEVDTPFAWTEEDDSLPRAQKGEAGGIGDYFDTLLSWGSDEG